MPKKTPGEFRLIYHLSFPKGNSIKAGIPPEHTRLTYATFDDAVSHIKSVGRGCFLAKTDIKNVFRIIPISPADDSLLGIKWRDLLYYDKCMSMGFSSPCLTFQTFSYALKWIAQSKFKIDHILHLLDDFLFIESSEFNCQKTLDLFLGLCSQLGVPMVPEKTCGPSTILSFASIELDTVVMEARLPMDKIIECVSLIKGARSRYFRYFCLILLIMSSKRQIGRARVFHLQNNGHITTENDFPAL